MKHHKILYPHYGNDEWHARNAAWLGKWLSGPRVQAYGNERGYAFCWALITLLAAYVKPRMFMSLVRYAARHSKTAQGAK